MKEDLVYSELIYRMKIGAASAAQAEFFECSKFLIAWTFAVNQATMEGSMITAMRIW